MAILCHLIIYFSITFTRDHPCQCGHLQFESESKDVTFLTTRPSNHQNYRLGSRVLPVFMSILCQLVYNFFIYNAVMPSTPMLISLAPSCIRRSHLECHIINSKNKQPPQHSVWTKFRPILMSILGQLMIFLFTLSPSSPPRLEIPEEFQQNSGLLWKFR
jgi:hypothetical protein